MTHRLLPVISLLLGASFGAGCSNFEIENNAPIAKAQALVNGVVINLADPIPYMGTPVSITLDATASTDDDGEIVSALWLATDASPTERYAGNGLVDSGTLTAFAADPAPGIQSIVTLGEGTYQYSVWVTDDGKLTSEPATIMFTVAAPSPYDPEPACVTGYARPEPVGCDACVCSPMMRTGCLETYNACFANADPMFTMLCTAVVACAVGVQCTGPACYTAGCGAQIDAAATYMGRVLTDCATDDPATNPCTAASRLGACTGTTMDAMGAPVVGTCAAACD